MRTAFFGGSFDPPHLGHLAIARAAQQSLALDQVLFAPVGLQPLKPGGPAASFEDRVAMTQLAIAGNPAFQLSLIDAPGRDSKPNYTIDTLHQLQNTLPVNTELFLLLGADSLRNIAQWHSAIELPFAATLVIASRPEGDLTNPAEYLPEPLTLTPTSDPNHHHIHNPSGQQADLYLLPNLNYEVSATQIRDQLHAPSAKQTTTPELIPTSVLDYIRQHHLYE